jgi:hypothetical protein
MPEGPPDAEDAKGEAPGGRGVAPEWALAPELPGYTGILDRIFMPLCTLKAACRNQMSNWFLIDAAVLFQAFGQGEVGKIQAAGGLFECHGDLLS